MTFFSYAQYTWITRVGDHNCPQVAPSGRWPTPGQPYTTAMPETTRPEPPRSTQTPPGRPLRNMPNGGACRQPRQRAEAASRRPRWPPRGICARHARYMHATCDGMASSRRSRACVGPHIGPRGRRVGLRAREAKPARSGATRWRRW